MSAFSINNELTLESIYTQERETLSDRLTQALRILNVNQSELARRIGVKPQAIQYLCTSKAMRSKFAFDIADALGINAEWLTAGQGRMIDQRTFENTTRVPLIEWFQIFDWFSDCGKAIKATSYINIQLNFSQQCYALKVNDCSMAPRFEIGTILIIDRETLPRENDFVVVATKYSETPIIRQLIKRNDNLILMPTNSKLYKEITLTDEDRHFGILRQAIYEIIRR